MTGGPGDHTRGVLFGDDRRHRMAEKMTITRRRGKPIARTVIVLIPIAQRIICPPRIVKWRSPASPIFPDRVPGLLIDEQMQVQRISRRALEEVLRPQPGNLFVTKFRLGNRSALTMDQQVVT